MIGPNGAGKTTAIGKLEVGISRAPPSGWTRTPRPAGCATTCRPPAPPEQSDRTVKVRARSHGGDIIVHRA